MGKASRWLCSLITCQKPQHQLPNDKRRWSFVKSSKHKFNRHHKQTSCEEQDYAIGPDKHAIVVASATAVVAEAAVAAAKAAENVVNLTSSGRCDSSYYRCGGGGYRKRWAAVAVQSAFRGYLARRALKALKALVRLQALVRGHIARKQTAAQVRQMQALLRVQARARAGLVAISESSQSNSSTKSAYCHPGPATPEKSEVIRSRSPRRNQPSSLKRNTSRSESSHIIYQARPPRGSNLNNHATDQKVWDPMIRTCPEDDVTSGKILEVDPGKPFNTFKRENHPFRSTHQITASDIQSPSLTTSEDSPSHQAAPSSYSYEAIFLNPINFSRELEEASYCTADNSPHFYFASSIEYGSSKGGPFTPAKSDSLQSYISGYSDHPNYMSNTESSKAKLRSLSAPKQRLNYERSSSTKRQSHLAVNESKAGSQRLSAMHASFANKAYPGSGRLYKLGMPVTGGDLCTSLYCNS